MAGNSVWVIVVDKCGNNLLRWKKGAYIYVTDGTYGRTFNYASGAWRATSFATKLEAEQEIKKIGSRIALTTFKVVERKEE